MKLPFGVDTKTTRVERGWLIVSQVCVGTTVYMHARGMVRWYAVPFLLLATLRATYGELSK